jgi:hypothetical protein
MKNAAGCCGRPAGKVKEHMKCIKETCGLLYWAGTGHDVQVLRNVVLVVKDLSGLLECGTVGRTLPTDFTGKL